MFAVATSQERRTSGHFLNKKAEIGHSLPIINPVILNVLAHFIVWQLNQNGKVLALTIF